MNAARIEVDSFRAEKNHLQEFIEETAWIV